MPRLPAAVDAVVVGAGPNGLVAANLLADAGWQVCVLEAQPQPGGAVRSAHLFGSDVVSDLFSAFYPLAAVSPALGRLHLEEHGLRWEHAPAVLAHPGPDATAAVLYRELDQTVDGLEAAHPGDGVAYREVHALWTTVREPLLAALLGPFPPVRAGLALATRLRAAGLARLVRLALLPVRRFAEEQFGAATPAAMLFAGNALHSDLGPEASGSALVGLILTMIGQDRGFPVPRGGANALTAALVARLRSSGGELICSAPVEQVLIEHGRAVGVAVGGERVAARRAVLADVDAPRLFTELVGTSHLPARLVEQLAGFQWDPATVKVNYLLDQPVPWAAPGAAQAGTVHLAPDLDDLTVFTSELARGRLPTTPFLLVGQMSTADPTRSPAGTESLWAYTHLPRAVRVSPTRDRPLEPGDVEQCVAAVEAQLERFAPGFTGHVRARAVQAPWDLQAADANLLDGAVNAGTALPHQQLVLRPYPSLRRAATPIPGLYLAGASAHPGGGVHGACGANAARSALRRSGQPMQRLRGR